MEETKTNEFRMRFNKIRMTLVSLISKWCLAVVFLSVVSSVSASEIFMFDTPESGLKLIMIRGPIEFGDDDIFLDLTEQTERAIVYLESPGGNVDTGISIAARIAIRGFTTLVLNGDGCHSICAIIWVSGIRRYMMHDANISVHAAYRVGNNEYGDLELPESGVANAKIGAFLNEIGLSLKAIEYFTIARPEEPLLPITPDVAQRLDIDIHIYDEFYNLTKPSERPTPRRITGQATDYFGLAAKCESLFGIEPSFWMAQGKQILQRGHELFGGEIFAPLIGEYASIAKADLKKIGFVRWCIAAEARLRADGFSTGLPGPSYNCEKAATPTEHTICSSRDLWAMDRVISNLYFDFRDNSDKNLSRKILSSQKKWLRLRNSCGANIECLMERYSSRLLELLT